MAIVVVFAAMKSGPEDQNARPQGYGPRSGDGERGGTLALQGLWSALALLSFMAAMPAHGATPSGLIGYEFSAGSAGQETHLVMGVGDVSFGTADLLVGAMRFRDRQVGSGGGLILGGGAALGRNAVFRVIGTRLVADEDFSAWRLRMGPMLALPNGGRLGLFLSRDANNRGGRVDGGSGEIAVPLSSRTEGTLNAFYGRSDVDAGYGAALGLLWRVLRRFEVSGELGLSNASRLGPRSVLLGSPSSSALRSGTDTSLSATTSMALRMTFP